MSRTLSYLASTLLLFAACNASQVEPSFLRAGSSSSGMPTYHTAIIDGRVIVFTWYKNAADMPEGYPAQSVNLDIDPGFFIDSLSYARLESDLVLVYETSNRDFGKTRASRVNLANKRVVWSADIGFFNLGEPAIHGKHLYLTTIGNVMKLDLATGGVVWRHDALFDRKSGDFISFEKPAFDGDRVVFQDRKSRDKAPKRIEVRDSTGEIIGVFGADAPAERNTPAISTSCEAAHLGAGANFAVLLRKNCFYQFILPCGDCASSQMNAFAFYYSGEDFSVPVPEGSVWSQREEALLASSCLDHSYQWPTDLPWFLVLPGVKPIWPCMFK